MNEITQELEKYRRLTALDNHNRETTCYHDVIKSKSAIQKMMLTYVLWYIPMPDYQWYEVFLTIHQSTCYRLGHANDVNEVM
jgi:hypothetical protein